MFFYVVFFMCCCYCCSSSAATHRLLLLIVCSSSATAAAAAHRLLLLCEEYVSTMTRTKGSAKATMNSTNATGQRPGQRAGTGEVLIEPGSVVFHCAQGKDRTGEE